MKSVTFVNKVFQRVKAKYPEWIEEVIIRQRTYVAQGPTVATAPVANDPTSTTVDAVVIQQEITREAQDVGRGSFEVILNYQGELSMKDRILTSHGDLKIESILGHSPGGSVLFYELKCSG